MTLEELRSDIPALDAGLYLNYGAHGPSPTSVVNAGQRAFATQEFDASSQDPYDYANFIFDTTRQQIAEFVGTQSENIALTESTTDGINRIANALPLEQGDIVVRTDVEHPAGILPWQRLEAKGITVREVETTRGCIDLDAFQEAVNDAAVVCFSALTWTHGTMLPVRDLVEIARSAGAFTIVDAVQVPGHRQMNVRDWDADVVLAAGHKWLLGPWGAGFMIFRNGIAETLTPSAIGYQSVVDSNAPEITYKPGALRFEIGSTALTPYAGLTHAISIIDQIGMETIESQIQTKTDQLKAGLPESAVLSPANFESGLVSLSVDEPERLVAELADRDIIIRSIPTIDAIRISVHAITSTEDIETVVSTLSEYL